jgi:hypothetical protein
MLASNMTFSPDYYFDTLNSPSYMSLSNDIFAWLNTAFATLPNRTYSINFVALVLLNFIIKK